MMESSMEGASSKCSEKTFPCVEKNRNIELPTSDYSKCEPVQGVISIEEKIINNTTFDFSGNQRKEMSMKLTITHDVTTQSTSPYLSPISSTASVHLTKDPLQISTPSSSSGSIPKSEILTFATNYNDHSSDTHSVLVDIVHRYDPSSILNRVPELSIEETFHLAQPRISSVRRQSRWTWNFRKCLCCTLPIDEEIDALPLPHSRGAPPTYSSIYAGPSSISHEELPVAQARLPNNRRYIFPLVNHSSFIAPIPPPSYAQTQSIQLGSYSLEQDLSASPNNGSWPPTSITTICPRCVALVVTTTEVRRSTITHLSAFLLCLCGCWPCCMVPYCLDSCKSIDHYCPVCRTYLGTYTPW